jgi:hypothetical protein
MFTVLGWCSDLFSEGVTSWDETGQVLPLAHHSHFPFWELWCMLVSVCFHSLVTYPQRLQDLYSAFLMFWMHTNTGPWFIVSSEGREESPALSNWFVWYTFVLYTPMPLYCKFHDGWRRCLLTLESVCVYTAIIRLLPVTKLLKTWRNGS